jgi:hypothetical protein
MQDPPHDRRGRLLALPPRALAANADAAPHAPRLVDRAHDDLAYIRATLDRSSRFTAVPGREAMAMGLIALAAAAMAAQAPAADEHLRIWLMAAVVAVSIGSYGLVRKAHALGTSLFSAPGRRFLLGLCPPLVAGSILTAALATIGAHDLLPGVWLLLYGAGVTSAGTYSVSVVPLMGLSFLLLGTLAFALPSAHGDQLMALGFGGLHLVFGAVVVKRHGG